jgi:plant cysteine oxidase
LCVEFFFLIPASDGEVEEQDQGRLAWLKEIDMPRELKMCSVQYGGPSISDK